jgi:hypothetical protein
MLAQSEAAAHASAMHFVRHTHCGRRAVVRESRRLQKEWSKRVMAAMNLMTDFWNEHSAVKVVSRQSMR